MHEENPFEDPIVAQEWAMHIEQEQGGSRDREIYPIIYKWTDELAPSVLVEIGAGQGICSSKISPKVENYIGLEPSSTLVGIAKEKYQTSKNQFAIGNAYETGLEANSVDAAFSVGVWFHIKDLDRAHKELFRILKTGGEFLIFTSNPDKHQLWESWFIDPKKEGNTLDGKVKVPTGTLSRNLFYLHSEEELTDSLSKNNLKLISMERMGWGAEGHEVHRDEGIWVAIRGQKI